MIHKVGAKGQIVIPKEMRERLGIRPGDRVTFRYNGDAVSVHRVMDAHSLVGFLSGETGLVDELAAERRVERERGDARSSIFGTIKDTAVAD